jgi:hypothetical protein
MRRIRAVLCLGALLVPWSMSCSSATNGNGTGSAEHHDSQPANEPPDASHGVPMSAPSGDAGAGVIVVGCGADCTPPRHCSIGAPRCLDEGACSVDGDCPAGQKCTASFTCEVGGDCGQRSIQIEKVAPNIMILLDRSGSMDGDAGGDTRWNVAKKAIAQITSLLDADIRFGLATYSSCEKGGCSAGSVVVPIATNNASAIQTFLDGTTDKRSSDGKGLTADGKLEYLCDSGDPETSTGKSLAALSAEPSLQDPSRTNAVILLTDGKENDDCKADCDGPCGAGRLLSQTPGVKTYVIGLGVSASAIDAIARAGGTTASIPTDDVDQLSKAFDTVTSSVGGCDYALGAPPPNTDGLYVFFDKATLPRDAMDGWSYEESRNRLRFNGGACEKLKSGGVKTIDVVYACSPPTIE